MTRKTISSASLPALFTRLTFAVALIAAVSAASVQAVNLYVEPAPRPGVFTSIQAAINAAAPGDVVTVRCGQYRENITMRPRVNVAGSCAQTLPTITAADPARPVVTFSDPTIGSNTILKWLRITGGNGPGSCGVLIFNGASPTVAFNTIAENSGANGGGIKVTGGTAQIRSNRIERCSATNGGGGIYAFRTLEGTQICYNEIVSCTAPSGGGVRLYECAGSVTTNTIRSNRSTEDWPGGGGLLLESWTVFPRVINNVITQNSALAGGGMAIVQTVGAIISGNVVQQNTADIGGGIKIYSSTVEILGGEVSYNGATEAGGGIHITYQSGPLVLDRVKLQVNWAPLGGGVFLEGHFEQATISNCVFYANFADVGAGLRSEPGTYLTLVNNTFATNMLYTWEPGDAVSLGDFVTARVANNWFTEHAVALHGDVLDDFAEDSVVRFNRFWDNGQDLVNLPLGDGNDASRPPSFVNFGTDFHLQANDPGVDAGLQGEPWIPTHDIDNQLRPLGRGIDIGADERTP